MFTVARANKRISPLRDALTGACIFDVERVRFLQVGDGAGSREWSAIDRKDFGNIHRTGSDKRAVTFQKAVQRGIGNLSAR